MKKALLIISLFCSLQLGAQWNTIGWNPYTIRSTDGDSTFVMSAPSRDSLQRNGIGNWVPASSGGASYLVYTALLTQTGTDAPVATVLENTLGGTVVWTYNTTGYFYGTLTSAFPSGKTIIYTTSALSDNGDPPHRMTCFRGGDNYVILKTYDNNGAIDGMMEVAYPIGIKIEVYP